MTYGVTDDSHRLGRICEEAWDHSRGLDELHFVRQETQATQPALRDQPRGSPGWQVADVVGDVGVEQQQAHELGDSRPG